MENYSDKAWDVYMSGALTGLSAEAYKWTTMEIYERVEKVCKGLNLKCYCPHRSSTTPTKGLPHSKVWKVDYTRVVNAGAVVAYLGIPSTGVGMEIAFAQSAHVPVILICEYKNQEGISRLVLGSPIEDTILFNNPEELEDDLRKSFIFIFSKNNLDTIADKENWPFPLHKKLKNSIEEVAHAEKYKKLPKLPITQEEWKKIASSGDMSQLELF
jgi:hypothetical protein